MDIVSRNKEVSIDEFIEFFQKMKENLNSEGYENIKIKSFYDGGPDGGDYKLKLSGERIENDKEFTSRLKKESEELSRQQKEKDKKEKEELALYKQLKKKFK